MPSDRQKRERAVVNAQAQIDAAPSGSGKGTYLKLPQGLKFFTPKVNQTYKLIFLPWKAGEGNPVAPKGKWVANRFLFVHNAIGPQEQRFICAQQTWSKACPVCELYMKLKAQGNRDDKNYFTNVLNPLRPKDRELMFVHNLEEKNSLLVWDESTFLFGDAFRMTYKRRKEWMNYANMDDGCIVEIQGREKDGGRMKCTAFDMGILMEPRKGPLPEWLEDACYKYCLDDMVIETPYEKLKKLLGQTGGMDEGEEEQEEEREVEEDTKKTHFVVGRDDKNDGQAGEESDGESDDKEVEEELPEVSQSKPAKKEPDHEPEPEEEVMETPEKPVQEPEKKKTNRKK